MDPRQGVNIPCTPDEVTSEWLSTILGCKIDPTTLSLTPNAQEDKGYMSNLLRIVCYEVESLRQFNLIVKLLPQIKEIRDTLIELSFDKIEIQAYEKVIPGLISQVPELSDYICPFIFGKFLESEHDYRSVMVMQDLKPLNFFTYDFGDDNIPPFVLDSGIDFLAMLHFAGSALENSKGKKMNELYSVLKIDVSLFISKCHIWVVEGFPMVFKKLANVKPEVKEAYVSLQPFIGEIMIDLMKKSAENPSIIHADLWSNNILCYKDASKVPKVIDWQILRYQDAGLDLAVFLTSTLPTKDITMKNIQSMVVKYWNCLETCYKERNLLQLLRRSRADFEQFFRTYGLAYAVIWFILSMPSFEGKSLERIVRVYEFFYEAGVISFMLSLKS